MRLQRQESNTAPRVLKLISERDITQSALAGKLHITKQAMSNKLNGLRPFTTKDYQALADYFNVSVDYLMGRIDTPWPDQWAKKEETK